MARSNLNENSVRCIEEDKTIAALADAMAHPVRNAMLRYLNRPLWQEVPCHILQVDLAGALEIKRNCVSEHIKILIEKGFLSLEDEEERILRLERPMIKQFHDLVEAL